MLSDLVTGDKLGSVILERWKKSQGLRSIEAASQFPRLQGLQHLIFAMRSSVVLQRSAPWLCSSLCLVQMARHTFGVLITASNSHPPADLQGTVDRKGFDQRKFGNQNKSPWSLQVLDTHFWSKGVSSAPRGTLVFNSGYQEWAHVSLHATILSRNAISSGGCRHRCAGDCWCGEPCVHS